MKLLVQTRPAELPTEALLARLRSRRATLDPAATQATETQAENIVYWVYQRLNRRLRKRLEPVLHRVLGQQLDLGEPVERIQVPGITLNSRFQFRTCRLPITEFGIYSGFGLLHPAAVVTTLFQLIEQIYGLQGITVGFLEQSFLV